jgi:hypothetical protein
LADIYTSTTGLIFFGTPFRSAEGMTQVEILETARREYEADDVQLPMLKIIELGNKFLQKLVYQFGETRREVKKAPVACFYEPKPSNVGKIVGEKLRTVGSDGALSFMRLTVIKGGCGQRELRLSRPVRFNQQFLALADALSIEQVWEGYGGGL